METPKRLAPTSQVIRRLFLLSGNQCAFPGCEHPIISPDGTYVGEICHIHSAEKGGERFDENQTNEDRRAFENLLLLCHAHHVETDNVKIYTPAKMAEIKSLHEARFEQGIADLEKSEGIQITNSIIPLGGEGGTALGAGGGGGGAIGQGSRAGDGGNGGNISEIGAQELAALVNQTSDNLAFGAGGGGLGVIGPNTKGGNGGSGGDLVFGTITEEMWQRLGISKMNVRVGTGGERGHDGQPSGIDYVDDRGNIIVSINSAGGSHGGRTPLQHSRSSRPLTSSTTRTYVMAAFLANAVEFNNGLFTALSGGWTAYTCNTLPADLPWPLVLQMSLGGIRPGGSQQVQIVLLAPDEKETVLETITPQRDNIQSSPTYIGLFLLKPTITETGLWTLCIRTAEEDLSRIPIEIRLNAIQPPAEQQ